MSNYPTVRQLRAFVAVAQKESFAEAARTLHVSQPSLSETIAQLEALIGAKLFDRTTRSVRASPLAKLLLPRARSIILELERVIDDVSDVQNLRRGHVDAGCLVSLAYKRLPAVIAGFQRRYPDITLYFVDDNADGLLRKLLAGEIDFAITSRVDEVGGARFRPLLSESFYLLSRPDHPLSRRTDVAWRDVQAYPFVGWARGTGNRYAIDEGLRATGITLRPAFEFSQLGTILGMVENGIGVAAVPRMACPTSQTYASMLLVEPEISREVGIATRAGTTLSTAATAFLLYVEREMTGSERNPAAAGPLEP